MSDADRALLPEGLHDDLPPAAEHEAAVIDILLRAFRKYGYARVKPPLVEFEESLLSGPGEGLARNMFRLMDPISQRMMGLRADMTTQVARIATSRLAKRARPLRLYYAGQVLRVRGNQLRPERQYTQAGIELIGVDAPGADAEVILLAIEALETAGVQDLSVDLTAPALGTSLLSALNLDPAQTDAARRALDQKDGAAIAGFEGATRYLLERLVKCSGSFETGLQALQALDLPKTGTDQAQALISRLQSVGAQLIAARPDLNLTIDPGESRGFAYQTGVCFTLFGKNARGELGRGGRYELENGESAVGFTYYLDSVARAAPMRAHADLVYLPFQFDRRTAQNLRQQGWAVVQGLALEEDINETALNLGCSHIYKDDGVVAICPASSQEQ